MQVLQFSNKSPTAQPQTNVSLGYWLNVQGMSAFILLTQTKLVKLSRLFQQRAESTKSALSPWNKETQ